MVGPSPRIINDENYHGGFSREESMNSGLFWKRIILAGLQDGAGNNGHPDT